MVGSTALVGKPSGFQLCSQHLLRSLETHGEKSGSCCCCSGTVFSRFWWQHRQDRVTRLCHCGCAFRASLCPFAFQGFPVTVRGGD